ncbi:hypothetical protein GCM10011581_38360 [Saccharopolyspora subtropica]|uniref:DUF3558 domain-containing protein n=1 Tax=Saccharopolyspora thermophila TaxID=89367 RepID=A0A917K4S9_9PSEU|nr:hypothetical protein GCM10011581_38360 [Saccharopolyspora subtropica]
MCAGTVVLAAAGCGGAESNGDPAPATQQPQGLAEIDPCTLLKPEELTSLGFETSGEPDTGITSEPGCRFNGRPFRATFSKNQEKSVESYGRQDNWAKFDRVEVDGRPAASAIDKSATQARICSALFDAGGGVIIIDVSEFRDQGLDECAEALRIAETIAPRMPR